MRTVATDDPVAWCQSVTCLRCAKTTKRIEALFAAHLNRWESRIRCGLFQVTLAACLADHNTTMECRFSSSSSSLTAFRTQGAQKQQHRNKWSSSLAKAASNPLFPNRGGWRPPSNAMFTWSSEVSTPNRTLIRSAVFAHSAGVTYRLTDARDRRSQ